SAAPASRTGLAPRTDCAQLLDRPKHGSPIPGASGGGPTRLAPGGRLGRRQNRTTIVPGQSGVQSSGQRAHRLRRNPSRVSQPQYLTLQLLWEEYKQSNPEGYQYSWF